MDSNRFMDFGNKGSQSETLPPDGILSETKPEDIEEKVVSPRREEPKYGGKTLVDDLIGGKTRKDITGYAPVVPEIRPTVPANESHPAQRRVVGWIVGIKGPCKGIDYRLHEGKNYIGRDERLEVYLKDDLKVSRGAVAQIVFDARSRRFFSCDCDGTQTSCYQNGELLLGKSALNAYDCIEVGDCELMFVPFCGEAFTWNDADGK